MRRFTLFALFLIAGPSRAQEPLSLYALSRMSYPELEALYRSASAGDPPAGYVRGRAIYPAGPLAATKNRAAHTVWKGKDFSAGDELVNRWAAGLKAVHARVAVGESWLDGQPSIVMDYQGESRFIWHDVRDELREVAPGLYLGIMFRREGRHPGMKMFFALEAR
jgi:hypothetical protein